MGDHVMSNQFLHEGSPNGPAIYNALTSFLTDNASSVLSIEILRGSGDLSTLEAQLPFLRDGLDVGIPKVVLLSCFVIARKRFQDCQNSERLLDAENLQKLDAASKVLLLYDPEHLTAANWRKRHLTHYTSHPSLSFNSAPFDATKSQLKASNPRLILLLKQEANFIKTLVTSPLKKHAKSPTLWAHRYWLIQTYRQQFLAFYGEKDNLALLLGEELGIILKAADRHFANYATFQYGRLLIRHLGDECLTPESVETSGFVSFYVKALETVQKWCFGHPRDISGWSFFSFMLSELLRLHHFWGSGFAEHVPAVDHVKEEVEKWAQDVGWKQYLAVMGDREIPNGLGAFLRAVPKIVEKHRESVEKE